MIKGCSRRIVILKDTGSDFFEEAYFVLKSGSPFCALRSERDFLDEANRIVSESRESSVNSRGKRSKKFFRVPPFLLGMFTGALLCAAVIFLLKPMFPIFL